MGKGSLHFIATALIVNFAISNLCSQENSSPSVSKSGQGVAYQNIKRLLDSALTQHDSKTASHCFQQIGDLFFKQGVMPQALEYYFKADQQLLEIGHSAEISENLNKIGKVYFKSMRNSEAMSIFRKSLLISTSVKHHVVTAEAYKYIAQIFEKDGRTDSADKTLPVPGAVHLLIIIHR